MQRPFVHTQKASEAAFSNHLRLSATVEMRHTATSFNESDTASNSPNDR